MSKIKTRIDVLNILRLLVICLAVSLVVSGCFLTRPVDDTEDPIVPEKQVITEEFDSDLSNWEIATHSGNPDCLAYADGILSYKNDGPSPTIFLKWILPDVSVTDVAVEAKVRFLTKPEWSSFSILLRQRGTFQDKPAPANRDSDAYSVAFRSWDGKIALEKRIDWNIGSTSVTSPSVITYTLGEWHTFRVEIRDTQIKVFIDGEEKLEWTDATAPLLTQGDVWMSFAKGEYEIDSIKWIEL
jgi:hypothetical protein